MECCNEEMQEEKVGNLEYYVCEICGHVKLKR
jgi:hypothetical protein